MIGYLDNEDRYQDDCPKQRDLERLLDHADYMRDCAKDDRICPPDPSPEELAADARDAAEDARTMAEDALWEQKRQRLIDEAFAIVEQDHQTPTDS